jgi:hypothetical protein
MGPRREGDVVMRSVPPSRVFLVLAALPLVVLAILAVFGAREDVGVVMTGGGSHALRGAAWVAVWLASLVVSPLAAGAALASLVIGRVERALRDRSRLRGGDPS